MKQAIELILMTKSAKYHNYCVAGINPHNGKWYRLVSDDDCIHGALSYNDLRMNNGREADVLDRVLLEGIEYHPGIIQTENCLIDRNNVIRYKGTEHINDIVRRFVPSEQEMVFRSEGCAMFGNIDDIGHSLEFLRVQNLKLYTVTMEDRRRTKADFEMAGKRFEHFSVTDRRYYINENETKYIEDACLVVSISEDPWEETQCHYIFIAAIYDMKVMSKEDVEEIPPEAIEPQEHVPTYCDEGEKEETSALSNDLMKFDHEVFGQGNIVSISDKRMQVAFPDGWRKLDVDFVLEKIKNLPYETKAILCVHREIQEKNVLLKRDVLQTAIEDIHISIKQYYLNLEKDNRSLKKTRAKIESIDKNRITLSIESKIPVIESIEFEINDKVFNQGDIIIEDYDDVKLILKVRAMRSAARLNWEDIQKVVLLSDTKFLVRNLDQWYDNNAGRLSYPPIPSLRKGIVFDASNKSTEEQRNAVIRSLNAPLAYVWGAPGTGKTAYVLANAVKYCLQTERMIGLFAPTNYALDMALVQILKELDKMNVAYAGKVLRLGTPTHFLAEQYPDVCEVIDNVSKGRRYEAKISNIEHVLEARATLQKADWIESFYSDFDEIIQQNKRNIKQASRIAQLKKDFEEQSQMLAKKDRRLITIRHAIMDRNDALRPGLGKLLRTISGTKKRLEAELESLSAEETLIEQTIESTKTKCLELRKEIDEALSMIDKSGIKECYDRIFVLRGVKGRISRLMTPCDDSNIEAVYAEIKKTVEGGRYKAKLILKDYSDYVAFTDAELKEKVTQYQERISSLNARRGNPHLVAATLDGYNRRIGVPGGETSDTKVNVSFDHIFLDEAGYCSIPKALPLFAQGCPVTMLGDHMQLQPISEMKSDEERANDNLLWWRAPAIFMGGLFENGEIPHSLDGNLIRSDLTCSYRFGADLAKILDKFVYKNGFTGLSNQSVELIGYDVGPHLPTDENRASTPEARKVIELTKELVNENYVILTPYNKQRMLIAKMDKSLVRQEKLLTVHKSQGREWDTVIVSLADEPPGYFTNSNREDGLHVLNTALSRAKKRLILVGDLARWRNQQRQMIAGIIKIIETQANERNTTKR